MNSLIQVTVQKILISIYNVQYIYNNFTVMDSTVRYQQFKFQVALEESVYYLADHRIMTKQQGTIWLKKIHMNTTILTDYDNKAGENTSKHVLHGQPGYQAVSWPPDSKTMCFLFRIISKSTSHSVPLRIHPINNWIFYQLMEQPAIFKCAFLWRNMSLI